MYHDYFGSGGHSSSLPSTDASFPLQAHLAQTSCRIETSTRPLAYNLKDESEQNPYHIVFNTLNEANAEMRDGGPHKLFFQSTAQPYAKAPHHYQTHSQNF